MLAMKSLAVLGEDVQAAYRQLLHDDEDFFRCAQRFGYAGQLAGGQQAGG